MSSSEDDADAVQPDDAAPITENDIRRSGRARVSRTIEVDGFTVMRANNYDLEGGERSVWDQELGEQPVGRVDEARPANGLASAAPKDAKPRAPAKPRAVPVSESARLAQNDVIKAAAAAAKPLAAAYARLHRGLLEPFGANIPAEAGALAPTLPLFSQPAHIETQMRDYQLEVHPHVRVVCCERLHVRGLGVTESDGERPPPSSEGAAGRGVECCRGSNWAVSRLSGPHIPRAAARARYVGHPW